MANLQLAVVPVTLFEQNASLLWCNETRKGVIVDPGGDIDRLEAAMAQIARDHGVIFTAIWLTHGHIDHAGGAHEFAERQRARAGSDSAVWPVIGPDHRDQFLLDTLAQTGADYGMPARAVTPDRWLAEGEALDLGTLRFEVLHCPGHTPGSVVLFERTARFALMGDVLFAGSVGRTDFPYGDSAALIGSIKTKLLPLGDDVTFLPGHGPASSIGAERANNPFLR